MSDKVYCWRDDKNINYDKDCKDKDCYCEDDGKNAGSCEDIIKDIGNGAMLLETSARIKTGD